MFRLSYYLIRSYIGPFITTFFISLFVLVMQFLWKYVDDLVGKGLEWYIIAELLFYASANLVPLALPLAILLSSLMLFGNLGEDFELVAMKSAGVSLQRIMLPLIVISGIISGVAFYFSNNIWPVANLKMGALLWDVRQQKPVFHLKEGIFYTGIEGYSIRAGKKTGDNSISEILIYDHTSYSGNNKVISAKGGIMNFLNDGAILELKLTDGFCYDEGDNLKSRNNTLPHRRIRFKSEVLRFDMNSFKMERTSEELFRDHYQMLNIRQLTEVSDSLKLKYADRKKEIGRILEKRYSIFRNDTIPEKNRKIIKNRPVLMSDSFPERMTVEKPGLTNSDQVYELAMNSVRSHAAYVSALKSELHSRNDLLLRYNIEWHRKFTLSIACFILFFIGAPLGAIIRKGGFGMPVVVSGFLFIMFHILSIIGEKFARENIIEVYQGMWLPSAFFFPFGVFLTFKAATDSVLMDLDTYLKWIITFLYPHHRK